MFGEVRLNPGCLALLGSFTAWPPFDTFLVINEYLRLICLFKIVRSHLIGCADSSESLDTGLIGSVFPLMTA